jgi:diguanylate cyclase (GGDEF)-like protein/PAS domain S-box-containing protein
MYLEAALTPLLIYPLAAMALGVSLINRIQHRRETSRRIAAERQLLDAHADLMATLHAIPDMLLEVDAEGYHRSIWAGTFPISDAEKEFLLHNKIEDTLPPESATTIRRAMQEADATGSSTGHRILVTRHETPLWCELSVSKKTSDETCSPHFLILARDITERVKAETGLHLAASVFSCSQDGILITDAEGRIIDVNPSFTRITGYTRAESIGKNAKWFRSELIPSDAGAEIIKTLSQKGTWQGEIWNRRKTGETYAERCSIDAVRDEQDNIQMYVTVFSDISTFKAHQAELDRIAYFDPLTGVANRRLLTDRLKIAQARARRSNRQLAICYIDLDGFKPINDTHGHAVGDQLLIQISKRLQEALRGDDTIARLGGDEFVLLLNNLTDSHDCFVVLDRVLASISTPLAIDHHRVSVSASIGVTLFPEDDVGVDTLMRHADQAMYRAKEAGKNCYHLFDIQLDRQIKSQRQTLLRLKKALADGDFRLFYQPKVNLRHGQVVGVEALIRWQHPELGLQPPMSFLPLIEGTDLEIPLGEWVMQEAISQLARWAESGLVLPVSINVSSNHLQAPCFTEKLRSLLLQHPDIDPRWIELEILETSTLGDIHQISVSIRACQALGIDCALDDFGTGHSSLTHLRQLPAKTIKIDRSFVLNMLEDRGDHAIVDGVIGLAKAFGREVIAEGLESLEHGIALLKLGCEQAQGFAIAKPMPANDLPAWIEKWHSARNWENSHTKKLESVM